MTALDASPAKCKDGIWIEASFGQARDLGPALLVRPLGPADVSACPELPQVERLWQELKGGFSARLVATAGAGKSVCVLQLAKRAHNQGWRVFRLKDPEVAVLAMASSEQPTLHVIDDAHLTDACLLRLAEEQVGSTRWLLSAHTAPDDQVPMPGAVRINPEQAVAVIAAGLRADLPETLRIVKRIDDRVGDAIGQESIEGRLAAAARAKRPWQFCFILGGGWRRARQSAEDALGAHADLVLIAAAIRQLASRDARARASDLVSLFNAAGIDAARQRQAIDWLVNHRLLLAHEDLRCPHQRLASLLIERVLESQSQSGHQAIGAMVNHVFSAESYPLSVLSTLLTELRTMGEFPTRWTYLLDKSLLPRLIARCWEAELPDDRRGAAWLLSELQCYVEDWAVTITQGYDEIAAHWFSAPLPGAAYGIGHLIGQLGMKDKALAQSLIARADPVKVAAAVSHSGAAFASEAAAMVKSCAGYRPDDWTKRYLAVVDRQSCLGTMRRWPPDQYLSGAGTLCQLFTWDDEEFGLDLIEALLPAIGEELRTRPFQSFHELHDMVWHALRHSDTLGIYAGKKGPSTRMRAVAAQLAASWTPEGLAAGVSLINRRDFQPAAWLLDFVREVSKRQFAATVALIDWDRIDRTIGDAWAAMYHEIEVFLQVCCKVASAKAPIRAMIARNLSQTEMLSARLAMLAPDAAVSQLIDGRRIGLATYGHFHWRISAAIVAQLAESHADLLESMIAPHIGVASEQLSRKNQPFFDEPLMFLRLTWQLAPRSFEHIMAGIEPSGVEAGWGAAFAKYDPSSRLVTSDRSQKVVDRKTAAWLVERALERSDVLGAVTRRLRRRFPRRSLPPPKLLEPFA